MDIDGLGDETVEYLYKNGFVKNVSDFYSFDYTALYSHAGFGEKKVALIEKGLERSKQKEYSLLLASLGFKDIGPKVCELLIDAGYKDIDSLIDEAKRENFTIFEAIKGIGERTATGIIRSLNDDINLQLIQELKQFNLQFSQSENETQVGSQIFVGQSWCVTGSFKQFSPRDVAKQKIKFHGGKVVSAVSGATTHLLAGENAGSKLEKAKTLGVEVVDEQQFITLLGEV